MYVCTYYKEDKPIMTGSCCNYSLSIQTKKLIMNKWKLLTILWPAVKISRPISNLPIISIAGGNITLRTYTHIYRYIRYILHYFKPLNIEQTTKLHEIMHRHSSLLWTVKWYYYVRTEKLLIYSNRVNYCILL